MPIYIVRSIDRVFLFLVLKRDTQTATALGKLGHPDGELNLTKAAAKHGVIQMVNPFWAGWCIFANSIWKDRFRHLLHALLTKLWIRLFLDKYCSTNCGSETVSLRVLY